MRHGNLHFVLFLDTSWKGQNTTSSFVTYNATLQGGHKKAEQIRKVVAGSKNKKILVFN